MSTRISQDQMIPSDRWGVGSERGFGGAVRLSWERTTVKVTGTVGSLATVARTVAH